METRSSLSRSLHTNRGLEKLEPYEGKLSCTVLRGEEGSNALDLPDRPSDLAQRDGRGVRAGNEIAKIYADNKVDVIIYAVEKSLVHAVGRVGRDERVRIVGVGQSVERDVPVGGAVRALKPGVELQPQRVIFRRPLNVVPAAEEVARVALPRRELAKPDAHALCVGHVGKCAVARRHLRERHRGQQPLLALAVRVDEIVRAELDEHHVRARLREHIARKATSSHSEQRS